MANSVIGQPLTNNIGAVIAKSTAGSLIRASRLALMEVTCCGQQELRLKVGEFCDCNCHKEQ